MYYNIIQERGVDMVISVRLKAEEEALIRSFAKMHGISVSELIRKSVMARIEEEYDLKILRKALEEHEKDPVTYSHEEVRKMLGFD